VLRIWRQENAHDLFSNEKKYQKTDSNDYGLPIPLHITHKTQAHVVTDLHHLLSPLDNMPKLRPL
jgi:hypothetical protein